MEFKTFKIYRGKVLSIDQVIKELVSLGYNSCLQIAEEGDFRRSGEVLDIFCVSFEYPVRIEWDWDKVTKIRNFDPVSLIFFQEHDILIILPKLKKRRLSYLHQEYPLQGTLDLRKGDFVVHVNYGIGKYLGRKNIETNSGLKDFLEIEYQNKEKIFVALDKAHLVQRYVNLGGRPPKLSRLGTKEWLYIKERAHKSIRRYALEQVREQALRQVLGGVKFSDDTAWQKQFEETFSYDETPDQLTALGEVKRDMQNPMSMDRLICGDVGYGKTEVAMRAGFKAVMDSKQVAFLVPTTILAEQHYQNFKARLKDFPVRVEMLSRFRTPLEQKRIVDEVKKGIIDIVIGTHRLLSQDVGFKELGLLIIDEEQRFGVRQKTKIKKLKLGIDVLTLTATPIPRTLYMGLTGIKSISIIKTPPKDRLSVRSFVGQFDKTLIKEAIVREHQRGGQIYFIENRIKNLSSIKSILEEILPGSLNIGVAFGRMRPQELEKVMVNFIHHKIDCLLSTAIIESGIDIPSANTVIVNNAHRFGLSDLHQLRGRVGRMNIQAYAYFLVPRGASLSKEAKSRLDAIQDYSHLGAGFELAMQDLEIRGAGNILGEQQHGFIWQVGLDLYCRLLKMEIDRLRAEFKLN
ncbi:MAG: DEAD/DEAH box helicase [Candidatus Omnitrophica bacterium]|nr:DEAD/DEAH box helicase [Candidatus Omnitrophota bacterium]